MNNKLIPRLTQKKKKQNQTDSNHPIAGMKQMIVVDVLERTPNVLFESVFMYMSNVPCYQDGAGVQETPVEICISRSQVLFGHFSCGSASFI